MIRAPPDETSATKRGRRKADDEGAGAEGFPRAMGRAASREKVEFAY